MSEKRIQFNNIVENQLPSYVREEFPLIIEFLKQYYISQDFQGSSADLIQNIDQYIKLDFIKKQSEFSFLTSNISQFDDTITVNSTIGFPDSYGLLLIEDEIITYTEKTSNSFIGCIRGFSGVTSYKNDNKQDELTFKESEAKDHPSNSKVINLSSLFLKEFFNKIKYQLSPGFEGREFYSELDEYLFLKQTKDFYSTRGTDLSFKILFKALYGEDVTIIKPQDYLIKPSDARYNIANKLVVESISGDPYELLNSTLFQDEYEELIGKGYVSISNVEKIEDNVGKIYYKLSFDAGYNRDIGVDGALYGNFSIHPKTKIIGNVELGSNVIDVDSTVGFPFSGELSVEYVNGSSGIITYKSKNLNQFFDCENIQNVILDKSDICLNVYAYGYSNKNPNDIVKVRITSVLKEVDIIDDTYYQQKGGSCIISTLGTETYDKVSNEWIFNNSIFSEINSQNLIDNVNKIYELTANTEHKLKIGDRIKLILNNGEEKYSEVLSVSTPFKIKIKNQGDLGENLVLSIQRLLFKANSEKYPSILNNITDVQNIYKDGVQTIISSPSIPYYYDQSLNAFDRTIVFSGTFQGDIFRLEKHGFYTGDSVYYTSESGSLFDDGVYFIKKIDSDNVKFAKSRSNIYNSIFIDLSNPIEVTNSKIEDIDLHNRSLTSQKLLRKIDLPINDGNEYLTSPGPIGILINGVEILNYKSKDSIYYGPIESINVVNFGSGYDVINPPVLTIYDSVGTGATGYCSVNGILDSIKIVDPGFDYLEIPNVVIRGGNGSGAKASASLKLINHEITFNSDQKSGIVNIANNSIGFTTYHKFKNAEKVLYRTQGRQSIGGISTNSSYYVSVEDFYTIKLHQTFDDAVLGINTIPLTSYGSGNHIIEAYNKKSILSSINIENNGINYENKKRVANSQLIDINLSEIVIKDHDFKSGEIINYTTNGTEIGGLYNDTDYYVTKIDSDRFKLSEVGISTDDQDFYYRTNQYIDITSSGSGEHIFNYPKISVEIIGKTGIDPQLSSAIIQPIFRGNIKSVHLSNNGVGYGSSEIFNLKREPSIFLNSGSECKLLPIVNNGKIEDVLIINPGRDYNSNPNISIQTNGNGTGAVLTPIVENGNIKSVKIIESGSGYDGNNTFIQVLSAGSGAEFRVNIKSWTINLFSKYLNKITSDDGFIFYNTNSKYGLQYANLYPPRKLRENLHPKDSNGNLIYGKNDLIKNNNNIEISSSDHSPIIGWAYDGNPIYGPYGYSTLRGGQITLMKSGYILDPDLDRPPFIDGFFIEDYKYKNKDDESVLDEYNGRFCVTPDFPNGIYAYFSTINDTSVSNNQVSSFNGYRLPAFPFVIGNKFKSVPIDFNFNRSSNQDDIDLNKTNWMRNTTPYDLKNQFSYPYINLTKSLNNISTIKYSSPGSVEGVNIISGGNNYKVNDLILFDDNDTKGFGFSSRISKIEGKDVDKVSVSTTSISNLEIYPIEGNKKSFIIESQIPHQLNNKDNVSITVLGINTSLTSFKNTYTINVPQNILSLSSPTGVGSPISTGIVTYFSVSGNLSDLNIKENNIFQIGNERVKVLGVDAPSSRIKVLRSIDSTIGSSHNYGDILYEIPRRFSIIDDKEYILSYVQKENREIYFDPKESLGIGTNYGVGIGVTIYFSNPGVGLTQIYIPTKSIYLPNHKLETGDELIYSSNTGTEITISENQVSSSFLLNNSKVYVAKISNDLIGISTVKVGVGSTGTFVGIASTNRSKGTLYFTGIGTGTYHSFRTNYPKSNLKVSRNIVTVSTAQTHGLLNNDEIFINVISGISTTIKVKYDNYNKRIVINPINFSSSDIDISKNTIHIQNHQFENGQKIIYTSPSPSVGLINNKIYYINVVDENTIRLSLTYYSSTNRVPKVVDISSASSGVLSPINPPVKLYKNNIVIFDLSDQSLSFLNGSNRYSSFEFNFYLDNKFTQIFNTFESEENTPIIQKFGRIGIDSFANISIKISDNIPKKLFYKLDSINSNVIPQDKNDVKIDLDVISNNQIEIVNSNLSGRYNIVSTSSTTFTYNILQHPEEYLYNQSNSIIKYETKSQSGFGPISSIDIISKGQNYYFLPDFIEVKSEYGNNAILESYSKSIGKVKKVKINDIGYDFSSDLTLRPTLSLPQILKIEPLNSLKSIEILSVGLNYITPPKLIVFDGLTNDLLPEVDLKYSLKDKFVTILNNTYRLNEIDPIIIPTRNSNGVGISSIYFNNSNNDVTVTLSVGFSTINSFPFSVGDRVFIENVSVGINSTGKGFNSQNYDYQLFTITTIDENIGGIDASITYNLGEFLQFEEFPGNYDPINSSGRVIPEKYFPKFKSTLIENNFLKNEKIRYSNESKSIGFVDNWNNKIKHLSVSSKEKLEEGRIIEGVSSKTQGKILLNINFNSSIDIGPYSRIEDGWSEETGILNNDLQRIQDNFYYQNFSYSLRSKVPYDTWENAVGSLNHTAGFKKFSDYQLESYSFSGISTVTNSNVDVSVDINGIADLNCFYDFDLAGENTLIVDNEDLSDEITFSSRILTDYYESVGNRVLLIDDISNLFNSNPRQTNYSIVHRFPLSDARGQKYLTFVKDRRYSSQRQILLVTLLHDNNLGYLNQYGRVETNSDLGSFDFSIDNESNEGLLLFYPQKYKINNYDVSTLCYNIKDSFSGLGSTAIGDVIKIETNKKFVSSSSKIISTIDSSYRSSKLLVEISAVNQNYQFNELNIIHDGVNVNFIDYGQLSNHSEDSHSSSGLGTYYSYISGSNLIVEFIPNIGIAATVNIIQVSIADTSTSGIGTFDMKYSRIEGRSTSIGSTSSPIENVIAEYPNFYSGGYFIVQACDRTNGNYQLSEVLLVNNKEDVFYTEFAEIETNYKIGIISAEKTAGSTQLLFTPNPDIEVDVKVYSNIITNYDNINSVKEYSNNAIVSDYGIYYGTELDLRRSFDLNYKTNPIFERYFDGSDENIVSIASSTIKIKNHFFVTGEKVNYSYYPEILSSNSPIGIASTDFGVGIGTTDKLPSTVYIIKIDDNNIKLARNAEDALKLVPKALNITSVGIGTFHSFTSVNQNSKVIISVDNIIQSPVVSTSSTSSLSSIFTVEDDVLYFSEKIHLFIGDLIQIDDEIMKVDSVGVGSTNSVRVSRPWMGTEINDHLSGAKISLLKGSYNIVKNKLNFVDAPYGNTPLSSELNSPEERDWVGVSGSSSFHGRVFMRTAEEESSRDPYYKNYIFDDISSQFDGINKTFTLKNQNTNITDIYQENAVILVNNIFQGPGLTNNYTLSENLGITSISFIGNPTSLPSDINTSDFPSGGIIVSIGSTHGFGYQPLISAGGTAVVSISGTISSISIGNSGSGYRSQIQSSSGIVTIPIKVGVITEGSSEIEFIGTAAVNNGNIVSIAITNPGFGYTSSNPPLVIIDSPLPYSNIPLIYSYPSSGIGTQATIDIVVGQGSSVIEFEIKNIGYGYNIGEKLTIPTGGNVGIPTYSNYQLNKFEISVENVYTDRFFGWSIGEIQPLDSIDNLFNGRRVIFPLVYNSETISIYAKKGSPINIQDNLLVFINDILQIPGEGYIFNGGSKIIFTEAPKSEDTCKILFYKGSGEEIDVIFNDVIETVKIGDNLTLKYDPSLNQPSYLLEDPRISVDILSINSVETNPYFGPGNTLNESLNRPIDWCKQTEDMIINGQEVGKNRTLYEPQIYPSTYLIQSVGIGSSVIFVESIRPFFNPANENDISLEFQNKVNLLSQDPKEPAIATAVVSESGTISSIFVNNGGSGYSTPPKVYIQNAIGIGTTSSNAISSISSGIVTSISMISSLTDYSASNPPEILIEPPTIDIETNKVRSYFGDFGFISGISTTLINTNERALIFDFVISKDSYLRNNSIMGVSGITTISGIQTGYYFVISNSNVGYGITSLDYSNSVVGSSKSFIDCVYQVSSVSIAQTSVVGFGLTYVAKVVTKVLGYDGLVGIGYSNYYGNFSWGKVILRSRSKSNSYSAYTMDGYVGLSSGSILSRTNNLKYSNYVS